MLGWYGENQERNQWQFLKLMNLVYLGEKFQYFLKNNKTMVLIDSDRNFQLYGIEMQSWYGYSWGWFPKFSKWMLVQTHTAQEQTSDYFFKLSSHPSNNHKLL